VKTGTFLVTHADADAAVLRDVDDGQILTLDGNPGVEAGAVLEATLEPGPMDAVWTAVEIERQYAVSVEASPEPPTRQAREVAADQSVGELTRRERAGTGEVHVLTVPPGEAEAAAADVVDDDATVERAARLGVERVEVRSDEGVVSVRYLP
jgi:hypothetical protein